jgi:hypothetical protein
MSSDRRKPAGIVLIAIYSAFSGVISFFCGLVFILASVIPNIPTWSYILSILFILLGTLLFTSVYGLWTLQSWGCKFTFWIYIVSIPLGIASIFPILPESEITAGNTIFQILGIVVAIAIILYLKKDKIQKMFSKKENVVTS